MELTGVYGRVQAVERRPEQVISPHVFREGLPLGGRRKSASFTGCSHPQKRHTVNTPVTLMNAPITAILDRKGRIVFSVSPSATVSEAVDEMNRNRVGSVLVLEAGRLVGIFTERDVLRRVVGASVDPKRTAVADVMTANVVTISPDATIEDTMVLFTEKRLRHLPVVSNGKLVGSISIGDITRWMADSHRVEAEHLKNYITTGFSV